MHRQCVRQRVSRRVRFSHSLAEEQLAARVAEELVEVLVVVEYSP